MIGEQVKDTLYCFEGKHHAKRTDMTELPGSTRKCCKECKSRIMDLRKALKAKRGA